MSVVNKMLQDLDKRGHNNSDGVKNVNYVAPSSPKGLYGVIGGLSTLCIVVAGYSVYLLNQPSSSQPVQVTPLVPHSVEVLQGDLYAQQASLSIKGNIPAKLTQKTVAPAQTTTSRGQPSASDVRVQTFVEQREVIAQPSIPAQTKSAQNKPPVSMVSVTANDGPATPLSTLRARALIASQRNDDDSVVHLLQQMLLIAPREIETRKKLAALLFSKDRLTEAQEVLSIGIEQTPVNSSLRLMMSRLFFKLGDNQSAFDVLSEHPYTSLANDELVSFRAALAEKIGQYDSAQKDYLVMVQRSPRDAKWWLGLGVSQDKLQLSKEAIVSYRQAQTLNQLPEQVSSFMTTRIQLLSRSS